MKDFMGNVIIGAAVVGAVKLYGKYKYYSGKCDANKTNRVIIDLQSNLIKDMLEHLEEREAAEGK